MKCHWICAVIVFFSLFFCLTASEVISVFNLAFKEVTVVNAEFSQAKLVSDENTNYENWRYVYEWKYVLNERVYYVWESEMQEYASPIEDTCILMISEKKPDLCWKGVDKSKYVARVLPVILRNVVLCFMAGIASGFIVEYIRF